MEEHTMPPWLSPPSPPTPKERLLHLLKRHGFALLCVLLAVLFAGLLLSVSGSSKSKRADVNVDALIANAEAERAQRLSAAAQVADQTDPATLSISSSPEGATVFLNHDSVGTTPLHAYPVSSGAHLVSLGKNGVASTDTLVLLQRGQSATLSLTLPSRSAAAPERPVAIAAGGEAPAPERAARTERQAEVAPEPTAEQEEAPRFVRVRARESEAPPFESEVDEATPLPKPTEPVEAAQPPRKPASEAAPQADDVVWLETKEEQQQRVSGYVEALLEERRQAQQEAGTATADSVVAGEGTAPEIVPAPRTTASPPDTTLAAQQERAREIIRKHEDEQGDESTKKKRKKKRGAW